MMALSEPLSMSIGVISGTATGLQVKRVSPKMPLLRLSPRTEKFRAGASSLPQASRFRPSLRNSNVIQPPWRLASARDITELAYTPGDIDRYRNPLSHGALLYKLSEIAAMSASLQA